MFGVRRGRLTKLNKSFAVRETTRRGRHTDAHQQSEAADKPIGDAFTEPETAREPSLVRPYTLTAGRTATDVELPLEAPVQAVATTAEPRRWPKNDVRGQIVACCIHSASVAEIAAQLGLPLGATRYLVGDLVTQGYLRVNATPGDSMSIEERRELLTRTRRGLRSL